MTNGEQMAEKAVDRLEMLSEIGRALAATLDLTSLYDTICDQIGRVMDTSYFLVALRSASHDGLHIPYCRRLGVVSRSIDVPGPTVTNLVIDRGITLHFRSGQEYDAYVAAQGLPKIVLGPVQVVQTAVFLPLRTESRTIGALTVQSSHSNAYTEDDIRALSIIASQAAVALENGRLFAEQNRLLEERQAQFVALQTLESALRASEQRYRTLIETSPDAIGLVDIGGAILMANPAAARLFGLDSLERVAGTNSLDLVAPEDRTRAVEDFTRRIKGEPGPDGGVEYTLRRANGETFPAEIRASLLPREDKTPRAATIVARDITERRRLEENLRHQAYHDALTGLPNRVLFRDRLEHALRAARRENTPIAVFLMDLDRFKGINDVFGHHCGDQLLEAFGSRLQSELRAADTVARLGGDEFAVLLPQTDEQGAVLVAGKVAAGLERPFVLDHQSLRIQTSIGIVTFPAHGEDRETLLRRADLAMYTAKREQRSHVVYHPAQEEHAPKHLMPTS